MKTTKILELFIEERGQLEYCGFITFQYYSESQFTPIKERIEAKRYPDFNDCLKSLKRHMRDAVNEGRAKDFQKQRKLAGWDNE